MKSIKWITRWNVVMAAIVFVTVMAVWIIDSGVSRQRARQIAWEEIDKQIQNRQ